MLVYSMKFYETNNLAKPLILKGLKDFLECCGMVGGAPEWIRTNGLRIRNSALYPSELPGQRRNYSKTLFLASFRAVWL